MRKKFAWMGAFAGTYVGSLIANIWSTNLFSPSNILLSGIGAVAGVFIAYRISTHME